MKKNKMINTATCDARNVTEESLIGFENITINSALLIVGKRSKELLNKYHVAMNAATVVELPDDHEITVRSINGKGEIGPDADGSGILLVVNGMVTIADGSQDAVRSYYRILINGKAVMPKSYEGSFSNIQVNGKTEYYPDGATILKGNTEIDDLFVTRASNTLYFSFGDIFFLDTGIDAERMCAKGLRFSAKRIVIAESLVSRLIPLFDEEAEIVRVPDGMKLIDDDVELQQKTVKKYGVKLCVCGDVTIKDAEPLSSLEYLFVDGTVKIFKGLEDAFSMIESVYDNMKIIDPELGYITDLPAAKIGPMIFKKYPKGVQVEDCGTVSLSKELNAEDIMEKLRIVDCGVVSCTEEQEEAVNMIADDVGIIKVSPQDQEDENNGTVDGMIGVFFGKMKDTQVINAADYKM